MATCVPQHAPYYAHSPPPQEQNNRQEIENRLLPGLIQNALQQLEFYSTSDNTSYSAAAVQLLGAISSAVFPTGTHRSARRRKLSRPFSRFRRHQGSICCRRSRWPRTCRQSFSAVPAALKLIIGLFGDLGQVGQHFLAQRRH